MRLALAAIVVLGLALRVGYVLELRRDVLFEHPVLDEDVYVEEARALVAGRAAASEAYWQPPGIAYVLAGVFAVAGPDHLLWPRLVAAVVSTACVLLVFGLGRRLLPRRVALAAAAMVSLHGVLVFEAGELLPATFSAFFDLLAVWLVVVARERGGGWPRAAIAGAAFGLAAWFSPLILVFIPVAAFIAVDRRAIGGAAVDRPAVGGDAADLRVAAPRAADQHPAGAESTTGHRRVLGAAALVLAAAAVIAPVTLRNWRVGGETVLLSTNGGLNFFIGNNAAYRETFTLRPGRHWTELTSEPDRAGITRPGAKSHYFYARALAFIRTQPVRALGLFARKFYLFFHGAEIPRDTDLYAARARSRVLTALVWSWPLLFPDAVIMLLALVGLAACRSRWRPLLPLWGLFASQTLMVSAFFVSSRHRAPLLPFACLLAALGADALVGRLRAGGLGTRVGLGLGAAAALVAASLPLWESQLSLAGELDFYRGLAYARALGDPSSAIGPFRAATAAGARDPRYWFELGNAEEQLGQLRRAVEAWSRAAELDPWDVRPRRRAAIALKQLGEPEGAASQLQSNLDAGARAAADYAYEHFSLGVLHVEAGRRAAALAEIRETLRLDPGYFAAHATAFARSLIAAGKAPDPALWLGLGDLFATAHEPDSARAAWDYARRGSPDAATAAELDRRVSRSR